MVFHTPINNLRGFVSTRPPLVVFTVCLTAFAITTLSLAYYVEHSDNVQNTEAQAVSIKAPVFQRLQSRQNNAIFRIGHPFLST